MTDVRAIYGSDSEKYRCFVVGPIGNRFDPIGTPGREIYEEALEVLDKVIVPACQAFGIDPVRADQIAVSGAITEQVLRHIFEDEVVIADVSGGNPNVMYELGLRHTRPYLTIVIGEYGQLPFDISDVRAIQFSRSERGLIDARKQLEQMLRAGLEGDPELVPATRIWSEGLVEVDHAAVDSLPEAAQEDEAVELHDEKGFLERIASIESLFPEISESTEEIGEVLTELGTFAEGSSAELNTAVAVGADAKTRLNIIGRFAHGLQPFADRLDAAVGPFEDRMGSIDVEIRGILTILLEVPSLDSGAQTDEFLDSIGALARSVRDAMNNLSGFGTQVKQLGSVSSVLRGPSRQLGSAVERLVGTANLADEWESLAFRVRRAREERDV